tara:strand:- start:1288 stop:1560 length:273 start_codon:yes stop_codon:yes gene_type:complete
MADKTLTITAPEELIDATIVAYAAMGDKSDESMTDEDHAVEMLIDTFREAIVSHDANARNVASRVENRDAARAQDEALKAQRDSVTVTIE